MNTAEVLYQRWAMEKMKEADVASCAQTPSPPGFTAINQCSPQPNSPAQAAAVSPNQSRPAKAPCADKSSRRRNPTVASYLGLGDADEPAHLMKYAPTPEGQPLQPQLMRKRRSPRNSEKALSRKKPTTSDKAASGHRRVSETPHVTKPSTQSSAHRFIEPTYEYLATHAATAPCAEEQQTNQQEHDVPGTTTKGSPAAQTEASDIHSTIIPDNDNEDDFGQLCFDFEINTRNADTSLHSTHVSEQTEPSPVQFDDNDFDDNDFDDNGFDDNDFDDNYFDDDLMDADLLGLTTDLLDDPGIPPFQSSLPVKYSVIPNTSMPDAPATTGVAANDESSSPSPAPKKFVSPITLSTRLLAATGDEARKPIIRHAFSAAVRDRSPIIGLSSSTLLRSCFRVGEAISQSYHAAKVGNNIVIELYARVLDSERDDLQQRFTLCDLFHARPPYIQATYAAAIWKTVQLFEYDSARLMQQGRICRCIGTTKRNGKNWVMTVLNIWEATWDDVQWVQGIVNS